MQFLLYDPTTKAVQIGTPEGLTPCTDCVTTATGKVKSAGDLTILNLGQAAARTSDVQAFSVPTEKGAIKASGVSKAYEGDRDRHLRRRPATASRTRPRARSTWPTTRRACSSTRRPATRSRRAGRSTSGFSNYVRAFTDSSVSGPFLGILGWNFAFAILSVVTTFVAGLLVAIALNSPRLRALRFYRLLIVLPYAMPSFAMLLVWRDMFNTDFGLINNLTGQSINWFGNVWTRAVRRAARPVLARLPVHVPGLPRARCSRSRPT